jgi:hypothetical protein
MKRHPKEERTMIELTEEQRRELECGRAVEVADSHTAESYVILRKENYEKIRGLLGEGGEWMEDDIRSLLARSLKDNGWDEAGMDAYDRYDEERSKRCP